MFPLKTENPKSYIEKDIIQIKGNILDTGDGKIKAKLFCIPFLI